MNFRVENTTCKSHLLSNKTNFKRTILRNNCTQCGMCKQAFGQYIDIAGKAKFVLPVDLDFFTVDMYAFNCPNEAILHEYQKYMELIYDAVQNMIMKSAKKTLEGGHCLKVKTTADDNNIDTIQCVFELRGISVECVFVRLDRNLKKIEISYDNGNTYSEIIDDTEIPVGEMRTKTILLYEKDGKYE